MFKQAVKGASRSRPTTSTTWSSSRPSCRAAPISDSPFILQVSRARASTPNATLLRYMAPGRGRDDQGDRKSRSRRPAPRPRRHLRALQVLHRHRLLVGHDRRLAPPLREERRADQQGRRVRPQHDVTVEGELGVLAGIEDDVVAAKSLYTHPDEVEDFVKKTGVDSLAISIGTSPRRLQVQARAVHAQRKASSCRPLRFDILEEIEKRIPGFPIVLHGASSVVPGVRRHDQQVRRQARQAPSASPRSSCAGRHLGGVQDQHRLRRPPGHDRRRSARPSPRTRKSSTRASTSAPRATSSRPSSSRRTRTS